MKAGLWIEPEVVGYQCEKMLAYYDEDCFLHRYGKKICTMGRYFLNFRNTKVVDYLTDTIRRMVEEYGAEYIKMDYNQDMGIGTGAEGESLGEGLEEDRQSLFGMDRRNPGCLSRGLDRNLFLGRHENGL